MDAGTGLGIVSIITAFIGPLVGVSVAHAYSRRESKRREAAELFRRISEDTQNYRHAFLQWHHFRRQSEGAHVGLQIVSSSPFATDDQAQHASAELLQIQELLIRALQETRGMESVLNADVLTLDLLFDKESEPCGRAIRDMVAMSHVFNEQDLPPFNDCQSRLNELIARIGREMKNLRNALMNPDDADVI